MFSPCGAAPLGGPHYQATTPRDALRKAEKTRHAPVYYRCQGGHRRSLCRPYICGIHWKTHLRRRSAQRPTGETIVHRRSNWNRFVDSISLWRETRAFDKLPIVLSSRRLWDPLASAREHCEAHLTRICDAVSSPERGVLLEAFHLLTKGWSDDAVEALDVERGRTAILEDGSPLEFSVKTSRTGTAIRFVVGPSLTPAQDPLSAGEQLIEPLERRFGVDASLFRGVLSALDRAGLALTDRFMVGVQALHGNAYFRVYLETPAAFWPAALGAASITTLPHDSVDFAPGAYSSLGISVDLIAKRPRSLKLYTRLVPPVLENARKLVALDPRFPLEWVDRFLTTAPGASAESLDRVPPDAVTLYVSEDPGTSVRAAVHTAPFPTFKADQHTLVSDFDLSEWTASIHRDLGLDPSVYLAALQSIARVDLRREYGINFSTSLQFESDGTATLNSYLSPRVFAYSKRHQDYFAAHPKRKS